MAQPTQRYKRTLKGSVGAGMQSLMGSSDRKYYILEHKITSKYHRAGESQEIIVDQVEIGRSPKCQVRFDESFSTVSRRHAAIVKDGENWKLVQLSTTNPTFLNGRQVTKEWYLQNGDEIQLSTNGPKMGFIVPTGRNATVGSIGLTRRLSLFRDQALRPYKQAIAALASLLLIITLGGGYKLYDLHKENARLDSAVTEGRQYMAALQVQNDSITKEVIAKGEVINEMQTRITDLQNRPPKVIQQTKTIIVNKDAVDNSAIEKCLPHVYFIASLGYVVTTPDGKQVTIECGSGDDEASDWSGTGFLLSDGRFVTAHHVVEPWFFPISGGQVDKEALQFNIWANNGYKVEAILVAVSSSGQKIPLRSSQFNCIRSGRETNTEEGQRVVVKSGGPTDYAVCNVGGSGLTANRAKSQSLERGTKLTVLGFPLGLGASSSGVKPIYGSAVTSAEGLTDGMILTTDTNYEHGNSGGPVFATNDDGELEVVGIVSAGAGRNVGFVVPISVIH